MTHTFEPSTETFEKLKSLEQSISFWSTEHAILALKAKKMLDGIDTIYESRQKLLDNMVSEAGFDPKKVEDITVDPAGKIEVKIKS